MAVTGLKVEADPAQGEPTSVAETSEHPTRDQGDFALASELMAPAPSRPATDLQTSPNPHVLRAPGRLELPPDLGEPGSLLPPGLFVQPFETPLGFAGRSGILPREGQQSSHFVPLEDRWRAGFQPWDRYGRGHPLIEDYPFAEGNLWDPYRQNVLKGDYPILGQHTFLNITVSDVALFEEREVPTPANPLGSSVNPNTFNTFGNPHQSFINNNTILSFDLSHGDSSFKPVDWRIRLTPIFNENDLNVKELGVVSSDVNAGTQRFDTFTALQEWFIETKLADLSADYDFLSARVGSQQFNSDFRGFIFSDTNRAVRLFGTRLSNRVQFNVAFFDQQEKDTNSTLNTFADRHQKVLIANYYRQDTIFPGYTANLSFHWNHDQPSTHYDNNGFLVRPEAAGIFQEHQVDAYYFGWAGDGHINRLNINHAVYLVTGTDTLNPMSGQPQTICAQMAAIELSYDRDWVRFRASGFYASGQHNINDTTAHGFDAIFDNPNFAGGQFSYWQRQAISIDGVNLKSRFSLLPNLRSSKIEGQANFVNPGLNLYNVGMDMDITPRLRMINNVNFLWFDSTNVLQNFLFQGNVHRHIGTDISAGFEYRPRLNNNVIFTQGFAALVPGAGLRDIYNPLVGNIGTMYSIFSEVALTY